MAILAHMEDNLRIQRNRAALLRASRKAALNATKASREGSATDRGAKVQIVQTDDQHLPSQKPSD
jgi:hypothetical protein